MAGLLDMFDDPSAQVGLGLLAAASPRADNAGLGQRMLEGINTAQGMRNAVMQRNMQQLQFQSAMRKNDLINQALQTEQGGSQPQTIPAQPGIQGLGQYGGYTTGSSQNVTSPQAASIAQSGIAPTPQMSVSGNSGDWSPSKINLFAMSGDPGLQKAAELAQARQLAGQTDITKTLTAMGVQPGSPQWNAALNSGLFKSTYVAPSRLGEGAYADPVNGVQGLPTAAPPGFINVRGADGKWSTQPVQGGLDAISDSGQASKTGTNRATSTVRYVNGVPTYSTAALDVGAANGGGYSSNDSMRSQVSGPMGPDPKALDREISATQDSLSKVSDPASVAALKAHLQDMQSQKAALSGSANNAITQPAAIATPEPIAGFKTGQENAQQELSTKWTKLNNDNSEAQNTVSYLNSIKDLASRAAVGPMSDKLRYVNGLLSTAGISDRALDATTANGLLDKYSNQIVARLGQGGLGTDAARSIIQSANPNAHMTADAINEASDNLIGANKMLQQKTTVLQPHASARDPVAYGAKETVFNQNADPTLFATISKYQSISDPRQRAAFAQQAAQKDPTFIPRMKALEGIGVKF